MNSCYSLSELISFENILIKNDTEHFMTDLKKKKKVCCKLCCEGNAAMFGRGMARKLTK